jgi:hypothetical protein
LPAGKRNQGGTGHPSSLVHIGLDCLPRPSRTLKMI